MKLSLILFLLAAALSSPLRPTAAQDAPPLPGTVVLSDLVSPRGLAFADDGTLVVTDAGNGGDTEISVPSFEDPTVMMSIAAGLTGRILALSTAGEVLPVLSALPSYATPQETLGVYRAIPKGDSMWILYNWTGPGTYWGASVVEMDMNTLEPKHVINLSAFEQANNPDGNLPESNPSDLAWGADGTLYITDARANSLLSWTAEKGLAVVAAWADNSVPTAVEVAANGDLYVGFFGSGQAPGVAKIERWSGGKLAETFGGLDGVTDILLDGDTLYAVQLFTIGAEGPGAGNVVKVDATGATIVADGLPAPFALAKSPDGAFYVTFGAIPLGPGIVGGVLKLDNMP